METTMTVTEMQGAQDLAEKLVGGGAPLLSRQLARAYVFAGRATFTLVSKATGKRLTFRLFEADPNPKYPGTRSFFAKLLNGPDNTASYRYLAFVYRNNGGGYGAKLNRQGWGVDAHKALQWFLTQALEFDHAFAKVDVWHTGTCGRCGRQLTVPESVASGIGPVCEGRVAA